MAGSQAVTRQTGKSFQELASTAFAEMLKKHNQPVGFKAALEASVTPRSKVKRAPNKKAPLTSVAFCKFLDGGVEWLHDRLLPRQGVANAST